MHSGMRCSATPRHGPCFTFFARRARTGASRGTIRSDGHLGRMDIVGWLFEQLPFLTVLVGSELLLSLAFLTLAATITAFGVPGVMVPISFSSGALLGGWLGMLVVIAGAVIGSHALFLATRRWLAEWIRRRWRDRIERFDRDISQRGFYYLLGLRLLGAPHMLVTAGSALSVIRGRSFVLATSLGFLPAITLASMAGSAM